MADAYALAAGAVKALFDETFRAEGFVAKHDNLHPSLGDRGAVVGINPRRQMPSPTNAVVQETWLELKLFGSWSKQINPAQEVDPRIISDYADRMMKALQGNIVTISGEVWYLSYEGVDYPLDPTGNNSRFVMTIRARGNNPALIETSG